MQLLTEGHLYMLRKVKVIGMKNNSFKRLIASAAIAVLLACNIGDAGTSVVSYAAAAATEQAAEAEEKAETSETQSQP